MTGEQAVALIQQRQDGADHHRYDGRPPKHWPVAQPAEGALDGSRYCWSRSRRAKYKGSSTSGRTPAVLTGCSFRVARLGGFFRLLQTRSLNGKVRAF